MSPFLKISGNIQKYFFLCHPLECVLSLFLYITLLKNIKRPREDERTDRRRKTVTPRRDWDDRCAGTKDDVRTDGRRDDRSLCSLGRPFDCGLRIKKESCWLLDPGCWLVSGVRHRWIKRAEIREVLALS